MTLGVVVQSDSYPGHLALTALHVGLVKDQVCQPSPKDDPGAQPIGPIVDADEEAALIQVDPTPASVGAILGLPYVHGFVSADELPNLLNAHAPVTKSGRTTGVTSGVIDGMAGDGRVTIRAVHDHAKLASGGDSGSIWMTPDGRAVALHYGGDGTVAFARAFHRVVDRFQLRL
jgi:hypothetical protein